MSYNPLIDFMALLRSTSGGVRTERMPGLDFIIAGLARAGLCTVVTSQAAPAVNQATTVWFRPFYPQSWAGEGAVLLYDVTIGAYVPATPALWAALFAAVSPYLFQSVIIAADTVKAGTSLLAIQRASPVTTALALPAVATRNNKPLQIVDWSSAVAGNTITVTPNGAETIMRLANLKLFSTADQLAGVTLYPSIDLNGWVVAP